MMTAGRRAARIPSTRTRRPDYGRVGPPRQRRGASSARLVSGVTCAAWAMAPSILLQSNRFHSIGMCGGHGTPAAKRPAHRAGRSRRTSHRPAGQEMPSPLRPSDGATGTACQARRPSREFKAADSGIRWKPVPISVSSTNGRRVVAATGPSSDRRDRLCSGLHFGRQRDAPTDRSCGRCHAAAVAATRAAPWPVCRARAATPAPCGRVVGRRAGG